MTQVIDQVRTAKEDATTASGRVFGQIFVTTDYYQFKTLKGNRNINQAHKHRLKKSMQDEYLVSPICVNEYMEVIDGQHRRLAAMELGLPIYYYVLPGYGWSEIHRLNTNMKNWGKQEYLQAYCDMGYPEYVAFKNFWKQYPDFTLTAIEVILTNSGRSNPTKRDKSLVSSKNKSGEYLVKPFEEGKFKIPNIQRSRDNAEKILMIKPYAAFYSSLNFIRAMISLFKNKNYNHSVFMQKMQYRSNAMIPQQNVEQYKIMIEDIYNYRNRQPVSLRY